MGRAMIKIRADEVASTDYDKITGMFYVILEGKRYPNWLAGTEPRCIISDYTIQDALMELEEECPGCFGEENSNETER